LILSISRLCSTQDGNLLFTSPVTTDSKDETDINKSVTRQHSNVPIIIKVRINKTILAYLDKNI